MATTHTFTKKEEIANAITHGIGALLSVAALVILIVTAATEGTAWHVVSFTIYGVTMLLLFLSSTLVHSFPDGRVKDLFQIFDHSAIYLFIAGTYTPILFTVIKGALGWTLFGIVWGLAIAGVIFKVFFVKKFLYTSTFMYVLMGWIIVFAWKPLTVSIPVVGMYLLVLGGVLYTVGTIFYMWRSFPYHHAVWHLFVLAGSAAHFFAVLNF
ncbi:MULTISPECIES: hemolysin III family protein [Bacillaceae]|uniref:PAQR family membrane homeostasis protein TrhA n=1 Tax=Bacillaceae TaxID=186817 RepID=UPI001BDED172|nr:MULTISPECIES: hemolysin III family protein [Bacillaceae]MDX8359677.1 hemolysin III family protein [Cytobacillus sp. IB215316]